MAKKCEEEGKEYETVRMGSRAKMRRDLGNNEVKFYGGGGRELGRMVGVSGF